jgi:hypothetical protein
MKVCILYWGLVRGFKYDTCFNSHKELIYKQLKNLNIDFDIYISTNDLDYDDTNIKEIPNLKYTLINLCQTIHTDHDYINIFNTLQLPFYFPITSKHNLLTCYFNRNEILKHIPNNYDIYISIDIGQIINEINIEEIIKLNFKENILYTSNLGSCNGINPRISISNYTSFQIYNSIYEFLKNTSILNNTKFIHQSQLQVDPNANFHPEQGLLYYLNFKQILTRQINITLSRIRTNGVIIPDQNN